MDEAGECAHAAAGLGIEDWGLTAVAVVGVPLVSTSLVLVHAVPRRPRFDSLQPFLSLVSFLCLRPALISETGSFISLLSRKAVLAP